MRAQSYISALILGVSLAGCGGWTPAKARTALDLSARAVEATDDGVADGYRELNDELEAEIQDGTITVEQFDERRLPWSIATTAVESARGALLTTERAVDVWDQIDNDRAFLDTIPCMFLALNELREAVEAVGIELPEILDAMDYIGSLADGLCVPPENGSGPGAEASMEDAT